MKFQLLPIPQTGQTLNKQSNLANPPKQKSSSGEAKRVETVKAEHLQLFREIHSDLTSPSQRSFFRCSCNHLVIEHREDGKCNRPNCECIKLEGKTTLEFPRRDIYNSQYWKMVEEKIKPLRFRRTLC